MSIGVDHATGLQEATERLPLLSREASSLLFALRIPDVNLVVGYVQITSQDDRLLVLNFELFLEEVVEVLIPRVDAIPEAVEPLHARVRYVASNKNETLEMTCDRSALHVVHAFFTEIILYLRGNTSFEVLSDEDGCARVAFLDSAVPEL